MQMRKVGTPSGTVHSASIIFGAENFDHNKPEYLEFCSHFAHLSRHYASTSVAVCSTLGIYLISCLCMRTMTS